MKFGGFGEFVVAHLILGVIPSEENMKINHIVLDANILIKNYNFDSEDLIQLIKMKDFFGAKLCLPRVVYDECVGNYEQDINEA